MPKRSLQATKVKDGDRIEFGDVRLEILETPGHTPEGISILVYDLAKNKEKPLAVLTGDTLFIGDVGRPDLLASIGVTADELADMLYDSLTNKLVKLPDETLVYPAHGAGSMCGKNLSKETVSTIGEQKKFNYALQPMSREEFKKIVTEEQPEAPSYFVHDAILNRQERPNLEETLVGIAECAFAGGSAATQEPRRATARCPRGHRLRGSPPGRCDQHRHPGEVRDLVRNGARPQASHRRHCRERQGRRGGDAAGTHRL